MGKPESREMVDSKSLNERLPSEFVRVVENFYIAARNSIIQFKILRKEENANGIYDFASRYEESYKEASAAHELLLRSLNELRENVSEAQKNNLNNILRKSEEAMKMINLNHEMIKVKLEHFKRRRENGGVLTKSLGLAKDVAEMRGPAYRRAKRAAGKGKRMVDKTIVAGVNTFVPRPVRKAVGKVGEMGQYVQDFWEEALFD